MISVQTDQVWGPQPSERVFELASRALRDYCPDEQAARLSLLNISENATFRVEWTDNQPDTVLRLHRTGYTTPLEIDSELAWIRALREESGIQTPHVILTRDGRSRGQVIHQSSGDVHAFVMFEMCPGVEPSTDDMATWMVHLGGINAIMHRHVRQWRPPADFTRRTWDTNTMFGDKPLWGRWQNGGNMSPQQLALLSRTTAAMAEKLDTFGKAADRFGLIHADLRLANLLIDDGDTYVIDFDDCGFGWYLYDAATALTFLQAEPQAPAWLQAWAAGYQRHLVLDNDDRAILPTLIMARRMMELAWMGSHAHTETARQEGNAYVDGTCEIANRYLSGAMNWL